MAFYGALCTKGFNVIPLLRMSQEPLDNRGVLNGERQHQQRVSAHLRRS